MDLRQRAVARAGGGCSRRCAADDLSVSPSFSVKLAARHERGCSLEPAPQGHPPGIGKLDPYRAFLIGRVKEKPDFTMPELATEFAVQHGVEIDPALLSRFLRKAGLCYKKTAAGQRARSL